MKCLQKNNLPATLLAACVLGLLLSPYIFVAIGALFEFKLIAFPILLTPLLVASGFLLWQYLSKPTGRNTSLTFMVLESISWIVIVLFLVIVSGFTLLTHSERVGLVSSFFLLASACALPVVFIRNTALKHRLTKLPEAASISFLVAVLLTTGICAIVYLFIPTNFI